MITELSLRIISRDGEGDLLQVKEGQCRLLGRHVADDGTVTLDRDANQQLGAEERALINRELKRRSDERNSLPDDLDLSSFSRGADVLFDDEAMSRAHAMVFNDRSGQGIIDLASTNGTLINEARAGAVELQHDDIVQLGETCLKVRIQREE